MANPSTRPEKIDIHISEGTSTLLIGEAPPHEVSKGLRIEADIAAPYEFFRYNKEHFDLSTCYLQVSYDETMIMLVVNAYVPEMSSKIVGKIMPNKHLDILDSWHTPRDLAQIIKSHRRLIPVDAPITWDKLYAHLSKFKGEVKRVIESEDDRRGNSRDLLEQAFETEVPTSFVMECELYAGGNGQKARFEADIEIDVRDRGVALRIVSVEMQEILRDQSKQLIDAQIQAFAGAIPVYYT